MPLRVVNTNVENKLQVIKHTDRKGRLIEYYTQVLGAHNGKGGVIARFATKREADEAIGRIPVAPVIETAPKSSYAEQQTGFKRK